MKAASLRAFAAFLLVALLSACELLPSGEEHAVPRPGRSTIAAYSIAGRIAVNHEGKRHYANIDWRHAVGADEILLTTPLGQGIAELARDARGARLVTADRETVAAADWEELSQRVFGFALPLAGMPRWLLADVAATESDAGGRPQAALADGWEIRYVEYESGLENALPVLIDFRRGDTEVRVKIDTWELD